MPDVNRKQRVLVVGAGPVGALAALYAAGRGDDVAVYDLRDGNNLGLFYNHRFSSSAYTSYLLSQHNLSIGLAVGAVVHLLLASTIHALGLPSGAKVVSCSDALMRCFKSNRV